MTFGVLVLFVGNTLIDTALSGLETVFRRSYTADLMVSGPSDRPVTVFASDSLGGEEGSVPPILGASNLVPWIASLPGVQGVAGQLGAKAELGRDEQIWGEVPLMGIDLDAESKVFPDRLRFLEGGWPAPQDHAWILLSRVARDFLAQKSGRPVTVGDSVTVSAVGEAAGTVIRELRVCGVIEFRRDHPDLQMVSLARADTLRDLLGFASLSDAPPVLDASERAFVEDFHPETLFDASPMATTRRSSTSSIAAPLAIEAAWQFLLIRTTPGADLQALQQAVERHLVQEKIRARVQGWVEGAGPVAVMALSVGWVFDGLVVLVAAVMLLITMNALVISITERTNEIGTMRALGAQQTFVLSLIGTETSLLTLGAAVVGLGLGWLILSALAAVGIPAPNLFFESLFGGPILVPLLSWPPAITAFFAVAGLGLLASWYPVRYAAGIPPSVAMSTREGA